MNDYRFYVPDLCVQLERNDAGPHRVQLPETEGHHARTVLRLAGGEPVILFDGQGAWVAGWIAGSVDKRHPVSVQAAEALGRDAPPAVRLTLATAVPKGDRADWLIEQASQLNVTAVQWLACDRGVVKPREGGGKIEKWRRLAVESAKQCHRTHVLEVEDAKELPAVLGEFSGATIVWLDPHEGRSMREVAGEISGEILALVGPEGGWSPREMQRLEGVPRVVRVRLTPTILRIETAAAAIAAVIMSA